MIKAVILDIDGVIVGSKIGVNAPEPHPDVIAYLRELRSRGLYIILCTAKPYFSIETIVTLAHLDNPHISDGGGIVINVLTKDVISTYPIDPILVADCIHHCLQSNVYIEAYTAEKYFIQKSEQSSMTEAHQKVLDCAPSIETSLVDAVKNMDVTKLIMIARDEADKKRLCDVFEQFKGSLTLSWGVHPVTLPLQYGIVTAHGVSKKQGAIDALRSLNISFEDTLGVGDSTSDWQFIELCRYGAAMGNATDELKKLVSAKGRDFSAIGKGVDENGCIDILKRFVEHT